MDKLIKQRREFNNAFDITTGKFPTLVQPYEFKLEYDMMLEELVEYKEANNNGDIIEIADAIGDMCYLVFSMAARHGMLDCIEEIVDEIHKSNMTKVGVSGKVEKSPQGKVIKPDTYVAPNIVRILRNHLAKHQTQTELL